MRNDLSQGSGPRWVATSARAGPYDLELMPHSMNSLLSMSFRVSAATLRASPFRTFLSTLGIVIGVASLVAVLSLGDGMQQFVRRQVDETTDLQAIGVNPQTTRTVDGVPVPLAGPLARQRFERHSDGGRARIPVRIARQIRRASPNAARQKA